jgi:hypothetical protein
MQLDPAFREPDIPDGERTTFRGTISGKESGVGTLAIEARDDAYVARLNATILQHFDQTVEIGFRRTNGTLRAESYRAESRDGETMVSVEEGWFRSSSRRASGTPSRCGSRTACGGRSRCTWTSASGSGCPRARSTPGGSPPRRSSRASVPL